MGLPYRPADFGDIRTEILGHVYLTVGNAHLLKVARRVSGDAQHALEGIIGRTKGRNHQIAGTQNAHQRAGDGMGAIDKLATHQAGFRPKHLGENLIQGISAQVVIAVAGGAHQMGCADPVLLKRLQHFFGIFLGNGVDPVKNRLCLLRYLLCKDSCLR